jgi:hypothetical protein
MSSPAQDIAERAVGFWLTLRVEEAFTVEVVRDRPGVIEIAHGHGGSVLGVGEAMKDLSLHATKGHFEPP